MAGDICFEIMFIVLRPWHASHRKGFEVLKFSCFKEILEDKSDLLKLIYNFTRIKTLIFGGSSK